MARRTTDLFARIVGDSSSYEKALGKATEGTRQFQRELSRLERERHQAMTTVGTVAATTGAAILAGLGLATKAAMDWESAWTGVTKTVDGSKSQMAALEGQLRDMAKTLPASHQEIAAVAEAAGQLGVKRQDVAGFTKTMIDMGVSTNLTAEDAATSLARLSNIMGTPTSKANKLGAAIVDLGNNSATTEAEILEFALRIAGAGKQVGLSEGDVLGFGAALSSVGIKAEAGGTAISRVFVTIAEAVDEGGANLAEFAKVAGMSATEYSRLFEKDAAKATQVFITGLGEMNKSGQSVFGTLDKLGLGEIRVRDALLRASSASDLFTRSLKIGNQAFSDGAALIEEANKRYATTEARLKIARNQVADFAITMGQTFLPMVGAAADKVTALVDVAGDLPGPLKTSLGILAAVAGAVGLVGGAALIAVPKMQQFNQTLSTMGTRGAALSRGLSRTASVMTGPWGLAIAAGTILLGAWANKSAEARAAATDYANALEQSNGAIDTNIRLLALQRLEEDDAVEAAKSLGISVNDLVDASLGNADAQRRVNAALTERRHLSTGVATASDEEQQAVAKVTRAVNGENKRLEDGIRIYKNKKAVQKESSKSADEHADATNREASAMAKAEIEANQLKAALDRLNGRTLNQRQAQRQFQQALDDARKSMRENGRTLNINTKKGRRNQEALDRIAQSTLDLVDAQKENGASNKALRKTMESGRKKLIQTGKEMGLTRKQAIRLANKILDVPDELKVPTSAPGVKKTQNEFDKARKKLNQIKDRDVELSVRVRGLQAVTKARIKMQGRHNITGLAGGGLIEGPGTGTSDSILALVDGGGLLRVSNREFVQREEAVRREGVDNMNALNEGRATIVKTSDVPGLATGGRVVDARVHARTAGFTALRNELSRLDKALTRQAKLIGKGASKQLSMALGGPALAWARSQAGKPYIWGGVGPRGYDCSGFMSAIVNVIRGRNPHSRLFSTASFSGGRGVAGFVRGLKSPFMVGVQPGSHMAGTLMGVNVESSGSAGVRVGGGARGASYGTYTFGLSGTGGTRSRKRGGAEGATMRHGGIMEKHAAHLSKPVYRVWAEPETGGEAYIPLSPAKRARSTAVLADVAQRFGFGQTAGGDSGKREPIVIELRSSGRPRDEQLLQDLRGAIRIRGGDPVVVLGQGGR